MPDVAIIGGGIVGLTSAYFLAKAGATVAVYDRGDLGKEASWAGAGILPPGNPDRAASAADQLRGIGSQQFPTFSADLFELTGIRNGYRRCGAIEFLTADDADVPAVWAAEGIAFERLTHEEAWRLEPVGAAEGNPYLLPSCAQVRNPWHLRALVAACERLRVQLHASTGVAEIDAAGQVRLGDGERVAATRIVLAAGAWSAGLLAGLGCAPPIHPVRGQIALLRGPSCNRVLMLGKRYLVPRGDGLTLVGSTEEPEAGFARQTTPEGIAELVAFAKRTVPVLESATLEASWAGLRPGSPDGLPYIGPVPGNERVVVAAGHFRAGVQLSIGTAQVLTDLLSNKPPRVPLAAFALDRKPTEGAKSAFRS